LFDDKDVLQKYSTIEDIFRAFFDVRRQKYLERREHELLSMSERLRFIDNQVRFVDEIISGDIVIEKKNRSEITAQLLEKGFDSNPVKAKKNLVFFCCKAFARFTVLGDTGHSSFVLRL
uniref:DNA topoisomerase (ATP-hydrolyzing) n=1 Tax=Gongylonema pulchrum TaxID=637853 RepID=A0A183DGW0_9BILA